MAVSRLGITPAEFYEMTPSEFYTALSIKADMEMEEMRVQFEAARYVATHVWNASERPLKKPELDPTKLLPFAWDKKRKPTKQTPQQMLSVMMGIASRNNKNLQKNGKSRENRGISSESRT